MRRRGSSATSYANKRPRPGAYSLDVWNRWLANRLDITVCHVVTSGGQIIESTRALRQEGALITDVVCVIDREAGGVAALAKEGLALTSLFTMSELKK